MPQPAGCTVQKHAQLSISHRFFSVFSRVCRISHRFLQCFGHLSTFCTCRLPLAFVFQLCAGVWGTSMRLRLVFSFSFVDHLLLLCCGAVQWWGGGGWTTSCGKKQQPQPLNLKPNPAHAYQTNMQLVSCTADADSDVADVAIVSGVISGYLLLGFHTSTMQKPRIFCSFPDKNFENDAKIELKKSTKSIIFATLSQKRYHKTRTKNIGKRKHRHIVLLTKTSQNTGFS